MLVSRQKYRVIDMGAKFNRKRRGHPPAKYASFLTNLIPLTGIFYDPSRIFVTSRHSLPILCPYLNIF